MTGARGDLDACKLAVNASIFFSSSATLLSVFFCLFLLGAVTIHGLFALAHRAHMPFGSLVSKWHLTFSPRHASHARGRFCSPFSPSPGEPACSLFSRSTPLALGESIRGSLWGDPWLRLWYCGAMGICAGLGASGRGAEDVVVRCTGEYCPALASARRRGSMSISSRSSP
jgi:hypothetical protein